MGGQLNLEDLSSFAGALERFERSPGPTATGDDEAALVEALRNLISDDSEVGAEFYAFAISNGLVADPNNPESARAFFLSREQERQQDRAPSRSGAVGRTQFASERRLQNQQSESLRFGRELDLSSFMENLKQMAFDRLKDKQQLLLDVDVIMDARRSGYTSALTDALPFILPEGMTQFPGAELDKRLGINSNLNIPQVELPIGDFLNAPLNVDVGAIQSLDTSTVQQPRQVQLPVA